MSDLTASIAATLRHHGDEFHARAVEDMAAELATHRADAEAAAGELLVPIPTPGTIPAQLLRANSIMRRQRDEARADAANLTRELTVPCGACGGRAVVCDGGGESPCDECGCTGKVGADQEMERLRAERAETMRRVRVVLAHFGVADCDDPLAALEEVPERADAVVDDAVAHANELALQVAALRAIIEGRTVAPTDAEIDAHEAAGGTWTCTTAGEWLFSDAGMDAEGARNLRGVLAADSWAKPRWWAHDANDTPCAWPSVSREPAR